MTMTCTELRRDLALLSNLIAAIRCEDRFGARDAKDLRWAAKQWQALSTLLETRRGLRGQKVVSLALWCGGRAPAPKKHAATTRHRCIGKN